MHPLDDIDKALGAALNSKTKDADLRIYEEESILVMEPVRIVKGKLEISKYFDIVFGMNLKAKQIETNMMQSIRRNVIWLTI